MSLQKRLEQLNNELKNQGEQFHSVQIHVKKYEQLNNEHQRLQQTYHQMEREYHDYKIKI